jgi:putative GTP pyrophosphokinase
MKSSKRRDDALAAEYGDRYENALKRTANALRDHFTDLLRTEPRIDRVTARAKDPASFLKKAQALTDGKAKYSEPLAQIQDQIGVRIITFFRTDVDRLDGIIKSYFKTIEFRDRIPESEWEFGYFGRHYVLVLPTDVKGDDIDKSTLPDFFELQVKTLFQHAWSEAEHDLGYKPGSMPLSAEDKRKLAYTSAQAWGADHMFDELFRSRGTAGS